MFSNQFKLQAINNEIYDTKIGNIPPAGSWPQPGWFGKHASIAFIGQNPGLPQKYEPFEHKRCQDDYIKYVIQSPTGSTIHSILKQSSLSWDDVIYTNLVKSPTPDNRIPYDFEIEYYKKYLKSQLECVDIRTFIIFGKVATLSLLGSDLIPYCTHNMNVSWNNQSINVLAVYHPSYVLRTGNVLEYTKLISQFIKEG